jgi:putative transposase
MSRSAYQRHNRAPTIRKIPVCTKAKAARSLSAADRDHVIAVLHEERFMDKAPIEIYARLLDEGVYLCSIRTMYRILHSLNEVKERRNIVRHKNYVKPELLATGPNQVWSWDITKMRGPVKWTYHYLYVIIDIFSRKVVGYMVAERESAALAKELVATTCERQGVNTEDLVIHSDRGAAMKSTSLALLYADLGITRSFSRPHVSNDNPFSESNFKTLKYQPTYPDRFGCIEDAKAYCRYFFDWYNNNHYHTGIAMMTPEMIHSGQGEKLNQARQLVLNRAHAEHPERFVRGQPKVSKLPEGVWINPPKVEELTAAGSDEQISIFSKEEI